MLLIDQIMRCIEHEERACITLPRNPPVVSEASQLQLGLQQALHYNEHYSSGCPC